MLVLMLGPLVVERDGVPVDLGGPRQRSVLAVLLLAQGRVVSLDRLIDTVYGGDPPPSAVGSIQAYISGLRRVLEPGRPARAPARVLISAAPGYAVRLPDEQVDAWRFAALAEDGRRAVRDERWQDAVDVLGEALALWRGDLLADLNTSVFPVEDGTRLEEVRIAAATDIAQAELGLGRSEEAAERLGRLTRDSPLRERVWELYALALYRCGRQADALAACARLRRLLRDELGLDPGPGMARLEAGILRQDPALDGPPPAPAVDTSREMLPASGSDEGVRELFVGRQQAMRDLSRAWASALGGTAASVLVVGSAGSGKTRLVDEFTAAGAGTATVVWGRGTEGTHTASLRVWRQIVDGLGGQAGPPPRQSPSGAVPDQGAVVLAMAERVIALACTASIARPVLIVVDDLHWLDDASLQVARIVLGELTDARVLLVATVRDDDTAVPATLAATLADLARQGAHRVDLPPLSLVDVELYLAGVTGIEDRQSAARVFARTAGHPFFVVELVRLLLSPDGAQAMAADSPDVPGGVRDVVRARVGRLPGPTRTLLAAAAVLGDHATTDLLEAASGLSGDRMLDAVEPALVTRIAVFSRADAALRFTHSLVRQAVAQEVTTLRRARILAAAVAAAAGWETDPARLTALADLALTAREAGGISIVRAVTLARSAAALLAAEGSFADAAALLRRAVDQSGDAPWRQRHELLVELAHHLLPAGDLRGWAASVEAALELAVGHRDWAAGGRSLSSMLDGGTPWSWLSYGGLRGRPVELLTELIALTPTEPPAAARVRCLATAVLAAELYFTRDTSRCRQLSQGALELARRIDDAALFATVVALSEMAVWAADGAPQRIALRQEALVRGMTPAQEAAALYRNAVDLYQIARVDSAEQALRRCTQLVSGQRSPGWQVALGHLRASRLVATGDLDAAEQLAIETYRVHRRTTMGAGDAILAGLLLSIRLEQGRLTDVQPELERTIADGGVPILNDASAFVLAHTGRHAAAEAALAAGAPAGELPDDGLLTGRLAFRAYICYDLRRAGRPVAPDDVAAIRDRLRPSAGQVVMHGGGIGVWGAVDLFLGMALLLTGERDAAVAALHQAVAVNDRAKNPAWGARARRLLARTLTTGDQHPAGGHRVAESLTQAAESAVAAARMPATAGHL